MGGVLTYNTDVFPNIINYLKITEEEFITYSGENLRKLIDGKIGTDEFWTKFSLKYGKKVEEELFSKFFNPKINQRTRDIIERLKEISRVVCGTNTLDSHYDCHLKHGDYNIFDKVYASNKMGVSKPDPDFYWYILREEGVKPEDTVFIDDTEENILSAQKIGIKSILFTDPDSLKQQIKSFSD